MADEEKKEVEEVVQEATDAVEEATEEVKEAEEAVEEAKEAVEEPAPKEVAKEEKTEPTGKFAELIKQIENLSVIELSELVKTLEDRFGVSAAPVAFAGAAQAGNGAPAQEEEEKSAYNVVLTSAGSNKIAVIKAVREVLPDLGLKEAKDLVEAAPATIKENMKKEDAAAAQEKLQGAGATIELQ
jgi:large subunit ribosomal protein L7/L12